MFVLPNTFSSYFQISCNLKWLWRLFNSSFVIKLNHLRITLICIWKKNPETAFYILKMAVNSRSTKKCLAKLISWGKSYQAPKIIAVALLKSFVLVQKRNLNIWWTFCMMVKSIVKKNLMLWKLLIIYERSLTSQKSYSRVPKWGIFYFRW